MTVGAGTPGWPALGRELRPWVSPWSDGSGTDPIEVSVVPPIAARPLSATAAAPVLGAATEAVRVLDESATVDLTALAGALLRSESVASSKIEHLAASQRDLGLAMLRGVPVHTAAAHVAANVRAMTAAVAGPQGDLPYHVVDLLHVHRLLMEADPYEGGWAGRLRTMQNWVGGGEISPHGALFVPPHRSGSPAWCRTWSGSATAPTSTRSPRPRWPTPSSRPSTPSPTATGGPAGPWCTSSCAAGV